MNTTTAGKLPAVSIIIPSYNTASLIAACLDSIFAQTFRDFEVIVVNDGSPDTAQLEQVLQPYLDKIVYIRQQNKRAAGARNTAIGKAQGVFLAFLDSDDSWLPHHLNSQMDLFKKDSALDFAYADALLIGENGRHKTFMQMCPSEGDATFESLVVERCQIPVSTIVVRKAAILRAGLFDETLPRCDDWDMWLRTSFHGAKIAYRKEVQARLNLGRPDSLSLSSVKMTEANWKILEKIVQTLPLNPRQKGVVTQRAAEIKARNLLEQGKVQLREGHSEKARELFAEANQHLHWLSLNLAVLGFSVAPSATTKLISLRYRLQRLGKRGAV